MYILNWLFGKRKSREERLSAELFAENMEETSVSHTEKEANNLAALDRETIEMETPPFCAPVDAQLCQMFTDLRKGDVTPYMDNPDAETMEVLRFADLMLPSGRIFAMDPLGWEEGGPYLGAVRPGDYPVYLYIHEAEGIKSISFAEIRFTQNLPVRFVLARTQENKDTILSEGEFLGYGVDSGTGCFMDSEVEKILSENTEDQRRAFRKQVREQLAKNNGNNYDTADFIPDGASTNIIVFSTGYGDGGYGAYWGYDADGDLCCLLNYLETIFVPEEDEV